MADSYNVRMSLIALNDVDFSVGGPLLLEKVRLTIEPGERIALIGRNGAGKSTLLRILSGEIAPDDGEIRVSDGLRVARLDQEVPSGLSGTVFDVVAAGLGELGAHLVEFHRLGAAADPDRLDDLAAAQAAIEAVGGWDMDRRVARVLSRLALPEHVPFDRLSGGLKRRVLLARALVAEPDLLLLDEPTNHLDIESIEWLEGFLSAARCSIVFVTHDRRFLRALATRIVEIDRGAVTDWPGDWDNYVRRVAERAQAEARETARFDKRLAQEEVWIRQGIEARRTRDAGRVRRLEAMRIERARRRERVGTVRLAVAEAEASGRKVIEARNVSFAYPDRPIVRDFDTVVMRGDRIGLIGANGSGKTTLLRLLLGELRPDAGEVVQGTRLEIAYFDQHRIALRTDWNALDNVSEGREFIDIGGSRKHVIGYLQDFLFTPERARAPITHLSGGERNRLLLAKLFARPSNLLVMDEPTNDLDVETLELLEELLCDYPGTVFLVSHDRDFLDRVVTGTLVMEGEGRVGEYVGGYTDWLRVRVPNHAAVGWSSASQEEPGQGLADPQPIAPPVVVSTPARRRLGYKESRELEQLPARIEALETELATLTEAMQQPDFYRQPAARVSEATQQVAAVQSALDHAYGRWLELES